MTTIRRTPGIEPRPFDVVGSLAARLLLAIAAAAPLAAAAMPSDPPSLLASPCGVVQTIEGEVQILDESRAVTHEARRNELIPCGSWISATRGNIGFKHVEGHVIRLAAGAFVQLKSAQSEDSPDAGGIVLFKGMVYVKASESGPGLRLFTSNGRIEFEPGAVGISLWDDAQEETQLLSLDGTSRFENRFESGSAVRVAAGEASSLNFKLLRVLPSDPAPMPAANVKLKIAEFKLDYAERDRLLAQVEKRSERQVLVNLGPVPRAQEAPSQPQQGGLVTRITEDKEKGRLVLEERIEQIDRGEVARLSPSSEGISRELRAVAEPEEPKNALTARRAPAASRKDDGNGTETSGASVAGGSDEGSKLNLARKSEYRRHPDVDDERAAELRGHLARRLAGGSESGEDIEGLLSPDDYKASSGKGAGGLVEVSEADRPEAGARRPAKVSSREEQERRRLLNELSKLKPEP